MRKVNPERRNIMYLTAFDNTTVAPNSEWKKFINIEISHYLQRPGKETALRNVLSIYEKFC